MEKAPQAGGKKVGRVRLTVAYDGTGYHGWQIQDNGITIESELNRCLSELLGEPIQVIGASRTDAGVHALGNIAVIKKLQRNGYIIWVCRKLISRIWQRTAPSAYRP